MVVGKEGVIVVVEERLYRLCRWSGGGSSGAGTWGGG